MKCRECDRKAKKWFGWMTSDKRLVKAAFCAEHLKLALDSLPSGALFPIKAAKRERAE